jgi:hypothetical protein
MSRSKALALIQIYNAVAHSGITWAQVSRLRHGFGASRHRAVSISSTRRAQDDRRRGNRSWRRKTSLSQRAAASPGSGSSRRSRCNRRTWPTKRRESASTSSASRPDKASNLLTRIDVSRYATSDLARPSQLRLVATFSGPPAVPGWSAASVKGRRRARQAPAERRLFAHSRRLQSTVAGAECDRCTSAHGSESSGVTVDGVYGVDASRLTSR